MGLFYLAVSVWDYGIVGFPLDDAWIHQVYARNLARSGQLAFVPGVPSAGSTAPLWTFLLSLGYLFHFPYQVWTYSLGLIFLGLSGQTIARLTGLLFPGQRQLGLMVGLFCVLEWHMIWVAMSGMETILFVWLSIWLLERYIKNEMDLPTPKHYLVVGLIGGLLILTRPEGLGLVGLVGLDMGRRAYSNQKFSFFKKLTFYILGVVLFVAPYIFFHLHLTGKPFPTTFYAKQAEYGIVLQSYPLWWRLFGNFGASTETVQGLFRVIFIGPQILLLPGLVFAAWLTIKERRFELGLLWAWWISFLLLYGFRLAVTYQHGRYEIPTIVWVVMLGLWGSGRLVAKMRGTGSMRRFGRVVSQAMTLSLGMLLLLFVMVGAQAYRRDVRFINSEMVATAKWLNEHVPLDGRIAAHDIGAIGYFAERPLIDLAGLVTPEIIPIIRNEEAIFEFIVTERVNYLVTFPSWYPRLTQNSALTPLYCTESTWSKEASGDNMVVYMLNFSTKVESSLP